jgi:hypothetical protein
MNRTVSGNIQLWCSQFNGLKSWTSRTHFPPEGWHFTVLEFCQDFSLTLFNPSLDQLDRLMTCIKAAREEIADHKAGHASVDAEPTENPF